MLARGAGCGGPCPTAAAPARSSSGPRKGAWGVSFRTPSIPWSCSRRWAGSPRRAPTLSSRLPKRRQHARQDPRNHPLDALKIGVDAVRQQQLPVAHDIGEEEGVEVRPELAGEVGKDAVELGAIFGAEVGRRDRSEEHTSELQSLIRI